MHNDSETSEVEVGDDLRRLRLGATSPQNGAAPANQTPPESRGEVLRSHGGTVTDDPALLPALAKVGQNLAAWEGLGLSRGHRRRW